MSRAFVKPGAPGAAAIEAAGLRWITVPGGPPVVGVRAVHDDRLELDDLGTGTPASGAAARFGRRLAALHAAGAEAFGAAPTVDATIGRAPMRNVAAREWPAWYVEHRVLFYLRLGRDRGAVTAAQCADVEATCARIDELAGPVEAPARLHGDLWWGNVHAAADGELWLIDPAAHGGHRETDLALLEMFAPPHVDVIMGAYRDVAPLADGWRARVPLHRLFPLLVHAYLFGGGYGAQAAESARAAR